MSERCIACALALLLAMPRAQADPPAAAAVDEILTSKTDAGEYAKTQRCLTTQSIMHMRVLSDRYIVFETGRNERWLAKLSPACPGLRPNSRLEFDTRNPQLCQWDDVRVVSDAFAADAFEDSMRDASRFGMHTSASGFQRRGPPCPLPAFQQVSQAQVDALREALKSEPKGPH